MDEQARSGTHVQLYGYILSVVFPSDHGSCCHTVLLDYFSVGPEILVFQWRYVRVGDHPAVLNGRIPLCGGLG